MRRALLHSAFFASGAAALAYEVLWMRRFTVLLGATAPATAVTLCAMFLGLGLGSALLGAVAARVRRPLLAFAVVEAGIALTAIAVEPLLDPAGPISSASGSSTKMLLAAAAILPPTMLMGGSLPLLAQALQQSSRGLGVHGGGLYAINTLGAAAGAIAVPTLLLPSLGARGSLWIAAGTSVAVAVIALGLEIGSRSGAAASPVTSNESRRSSWPRGVLLGAAFLSGSLALALEVLWTRMLALVHENSLYSFATVIAVFLAGMGAGAGLARLLLVRGVRPRTIIGLGWVGSGAWLLVTPTLFHALTSGLDYVGGNEGLLRHEVEIAGLALATMLPATVLAGAVLPALMELMGGHAAGSSGRALGRLIGANTLGAIAGPLVALFWIGPRFGLWWGLVLMGIVQLTAGTAALVAWPARSGAWPRRLAGLAVAVAVLVLWRPGDLPRVRLEPGARLVELREGPFGTVAVVASGAHRRLMINNYYVLGGTASTGEERLQAHVPLLLHPHPHKVAFLGLGTGITASGALFHRVQEVVAMELVPEVVAAAREQFDEANLGVVTDPRVRVLVEDARTGLRARPGAFDVIVGDLVVPWRRGESALYTRESFESARAALAEGGIFCQWLPLFQLSRASYESVAASFLDVFPETLLWKGDFRAGEPALALIGLTGGLPLDLRAIEDNERALGSGPDPTNPFLRAPGGVWVYLAGALTPTSFADAPRSHDDHPLVELASPEAQFGGGGEGSPFTRSPLERYLDELRAAPLAGTPLAGLGAEQLRTRDAGALMWSASLLELEGKREEADALGFTALSMLPEPLQRALGTDLKPVPD